MTTHKYQFAYSMIVREGKKQISMYIPEEIHDEIKESAALRKLTIKDYFLFLHKSNSSPGKNPDVYDMVSKLYEKLISQVEATITPRKTSRTKPPRAIPSETTPQGKSFVKVISLTVHEQNQIATLPDRIGKFIQTIANTNQREKTIRVILCIHGAQKITRNEIKQKLELRGKSAPKQLDRMVNLGLIVKNTDQIPHIYSINYEY